MSTGNGYYQSWPLPSYSRATPATPTGPASSSTYAMQGLGALITPAVSGIIKAEIFGTVTLTNTTTTVGTGISVKMYYAPMVNGVAAPVNAATILNSAVQISPVVSWSTGTTLTTAEDATAPLFVSSIVGGLTVGQQYWFDLAAIYLVVQEVEIANPQVVLYEVT